MIVTTKYKLPYTGEELLRKLSEIDKIPELQNQIDILSQNQGSGGENGSTGGEDDSSGTELQIVLHPFSEKGVVL